MVFANSLTKAGRLMELQLIFATRPYRAHSTRELAGRLGIAVRTVRNYLTELSVSGRLPIVQEKKRWRLAPDAKIETPPVRFMLEEAAAVYLEAAQACREAALASRRERVMRCRLVVKQHAIAVIAAASGAWS
jgi:predicted DNA-binding transcriptional regulator YafY